MKRKYLSKMFAMAMAAVMVFGSNGLSALAADGDEANAPQGTAAGDGVVVSTGEAIAEFDTTEDAGWSVINDDDTDAAANDTTADISIWAKVVEHGDYVYKVDIAWGAMKFEFNNQAGKWNTDTHTYDPKDDNVEAEWTEEDYIDAENNLIEVENHSNWAVDTTFSYTHDGASFNTDTNSGDAVRGHFFLDNDAAVTASKVLTNSATVSNALTTALTLGHQDKSNATKYGGSVGGEELDGTNVPAVTAYEEGSCKRKVYFTFNGTPDVESLDDAIKTDFIKVGVITVTIVPWEETP